MGRIPASERTREKLNVLVGGTQETGELGSELVRLAARLILDEALEGAAEDALGRGYSMRGAMPGAGYRNGYRTGRLRTAEGAVAYGAPQIADRAEPFRSTIRAILGNRTDELEALAVEMYARGLSTRDIEAVFADETGQSLSRRSAVSAATERLWAACEAFAGRDLGEFAVVCLFVDGIAERLHLGQSREAVLAAWGILADGKKALLHLAPGTKADTASCREVLPRPASARPARSVAGRQRWDGGGDPRHRGVFPALDAPALPGTQDAESAEQGAGGCPAGVQGACRGPLSSRLAGAGAFVARRHRGDP